MEADTAYDPELEALIAPLPDRAPTFLHHKYPQVNNSPDAHLCTQTIFLNEEFG